MFSKDIDHPGRSQIKEVEMNKELDAIVLGVNSILGWVQIFTHGCRYTCWTKEIDGELFFTFKKRWFRVSDYTTEHTSVLLKEGGKTISRSFNCK